MKNYKKILDTDKQETKEWLESISAIIDEKGSDRAHFILENLIDYSRMNGVTLPYNLNTQYVNTIHLRDQDSYPGNRSIERRIKSLIRCFL